MFSFRSLLPSLATVSLSTLALVATTGCGVTAGLSAPSLSVTGAKSSPVASSGGGTYEERQRARMEERQQELEAEKKEREANRVANAAKQDAENKQRFAKTADEAIAEIRAECKKDDLAISLYRDALHDHVQSLRTWDSMKSEPEFAARNATLEATLTECVVGPKDEYKGKDAAGMRRMFADAIGKHAGGKVIHLAFLDEDFERKQGIEDGHFFDSYFIHAFAIVSFPDRQEIWTLYGERDTLNNNKLTFRSHEPKSRFTLAFKAPGNIK